jgi:hypothetical protein
MRKQFSLLLFVSVVCIPSLADDTPWLIEDVRGGEEGAEYLAITPEAYSKTLTPLIEWRSDQGLRARMVTTESILDEFEGIRPFVRHAAKNWKEPKIRFLLLAADVDAIPAFIVDAPSVGTCATDNLYGCLDDDPVPTIAVGRFPAKDAGDLKGMVEKTIRYGRDIPAAPWRKEFAFIAGEGGFGPIIDTILESMFTKIVSDVIPYEYDVDLSYHNPASPYAYPHARFADHVVDRMNRGSLIFTYVGHGHPQSFDREILRLKDVGSVDCGSGPPVVIVLACSTGHYDDPARDCIGEALIKRPRGPVAFFGSSRVSQPYAMGLLGLGIVDEFSAPGDGRTLGEILVGAKRRMIADPENPIRKEIDGMGSLLLPPKTMEEQRVEHLSLFNLLGDPALRIAYPDVLRDLVAPDAVRAGRTFRVEGKAEGVRSGEVIISIEVERKRIIGEVVPGDSDEAILKNHRIANDKTVVEKKARLKRGKFEAKISVPRDAPLGACHLKVYVRGKERIAIASRPLAITQAGGGDF